MVSLKVCARGDLPSATRTPVWLQREKSTVSLKGCSRGDLPIAERAPAWRQRGKIYGKYKIFSLRLTQGEEIVKSASVESDREDSR